MFYPCGPGSDEVDVYPCGPGSDEVDVYPCGPGSDEVDVYSFVESNRLRFVILLNKVRMRKLFLYILLFSSLEYVSF